MNFLLIQAIFSLLGMQVDSLHEANLLAQINFLRRNERWDEQQQTTVRAKMKEQESVLRDYLGRLGMLGDIEPGLEHFTYALVMGGPRETSLFRFECLKDLLSRGYRFDHIVLLSGERQLLDDEKEGLSDQITTEGAMMNFLVRQDPFFASYQIEVVNAPGIVHDDGTVSRPTTDSTLVKFAEQFPTPGSCLVISNNPYIQRQTKVAQRILDQSKFPTYGAGKVDLRDTTDIIILMDELARTLWELTRVKV